MKVDSDKYDSCDFRLGLFSSLGGPKTSSPSSLIGMAVAAGRSCDTRLVACGPENKGAGGRGLLGLPPYRDDGVPGRGLPFRSAGSYAIGEMGRREDCEDVLDGVNVRVGDSGAYGEYGGAPVVGGGMVGAVSRMDGDCDRGREGEALGRYLEGEPELWESLGELCFAKCTRIVARRFGFSFLSPTWAVDDHSNGGAGASSRPLNWRNPIAGREFWASLGFLRDLRLGLTAALGGFGRGTYERLGEFSSVLRRLIDEPLLRRFVGVSSLGTVE